MSRPTYEELASICDRITRLLAEVELLYGSHPYDTYPSEVEMTVHLAWAAAYRALTEMEKDHGIR